MSVPTPRTDSGAPSSSVHASSAHGEAARSDNIEVAQQASATDADVSSSSLGNFSFPRAPEFDSPPKSSPSFTRRTSSDPPSPGSLTRRKAPPPLSFRKSDERASLRVQQEEIDPLQLNDSTRNDDASGRVGAARTDRGSFSVHADRTGPSAGRTDDLSTSLPPIGIRNYTGLGLGMPFSMSAAAGLSTLAHSTSSSPPLQRTPSISEFDDSSYGRNRSASNRSDSIAESPVTDRSKLIGLGELATPRWTSAALERRWESPDAAQLRELPPVHDSIPEQDGEDFDVTESYRADHTETSISHTSFVDSPTYARPSHRSSLPTSRVSSGNSSLPSATHSVHPSNLFPTSPHPPLPIPPKLATPHSGDNSFEALYRNQSSSGNPLLSSSLGLGLDHDAASDSTALAAASAALLSPQSRRVSSGSVASSRRSSVGKAGVIDPKPSKHSRRASASKSGFAHLPPSPATTSTTQRLSTSAAVPRTSTTALPSQPPPSTTSQSQPNTALPRTPDLARHSFPHPNHGHHSSPSVIAASILRQTRDLELDGVDASTDNGTSEALRKLDGLGPASSPRLSKVIPSSSSAGSGRSRTASRETGLSPSRLSVKEGDDARRRRTRSSDVGLVAGDARKSPATTLDSASSSPALGSTSPTTPLSPLSASHTSRSPLPPLPPAQLPLSRHSSQTRSPSIAYDVPFPSVSPFKRGSSSSTNAGASTSATTDSRDSTSGTSLSGSSIGGSNVARSNKNRRGSVGSDVSSINSAGDAAIMRLDPAENRDGFEAAFIPPVPPIPKDYESYRPATDASSSTYASSPRFGPVRMNSETSSLAESARSPRLSELDTSFGGQSTGKTPPRKWSISGAFGKSKSPKASSIKESVSYSDLSSSMSQPRPRLASVSSHLSDPWYPRRLAGSTNDIAGLASNGSTSRSPVAAPSPSGLGSRVRQSLRTEKQSTTEIPRTRTSSISSGGTATNQHASDSTPSVVAISPGRSRSSLLSPRRTPSGIPFFSRKSSSNNVVGLASPSGDKALPSPEGRRSILGLNFLRSTASRREKEKSTPTAVLKRSTGPSTLPNKASESVGEFGTRVGEFGTRGATGSTIITPLRKRGKTLSGVEQSPPDAQPSNLPPIQIAALPSTTLRRVDSLVASESSSTLSSRAQLTPNKMQTSVRSLRNQESAAKGNLPTIAGSPSSHQPVVESSSSYSISTLSSTDAHSKPNTPTKIPRLQYRTAVADSSAISRASEAQSEILPTPKRRASHFGTTSDSSTRAPSYATTSNQLPSETELFSTVDFGTSREPGLALGERSLATRRRLGSNDSQIPRSRSTTTPSSSIRLPKEGSTSVVSSRAGTVLPRSFGTEETTSSNATPRLSSGTPRLPAAAPEPTHPLNVARRVSKVSEGPTLAPVRRSSALSNSASESLPSARSSRAISTKMGPPVRTSRGTTTPAMSPAPSDSSRSVSSTSQNAPTVSEEEMRADEEMSAYVRRQRTKKLAAGMSAETIQKMFEFPDPTTPIPPLSCRDASALYSRSLTEYEKVEIGSYKKIYFAGQNISKLPASENDRANNFGYDDDRGDYLLVPHDHIRYRYEVIDVLGKGSFGQVLQCRDHCTGEMVAIKIIRNKKRFHHQALVEIKVLENLVKWDPDEKHYVIRMVDSFTFREHLCIVTELLSINLYELVKANGFAGFSTTLIRRFTTQILGSLSLLRHHRVVHCDLKPENILLKHPAKSAIKVIDFGSSCFEHEKVYTYIQSRFYRSPEVILGMNYHMAIDMWSLGCILAEMYTGYPIFPGENEQEQLACIMEVLGVPDKYLVDRSSRKKLFFDSTGAPRPVTNSKGRRRRAGAKTLAQVLKSDDELFVDFIAKCLVWDPDRRCKPDSAARHPWIARRATPSTIVIPARTPRQSVVTTAASLGPISTPRKRIGASSSTTTASVPRVRTASTSTLPVPPRLTSMASLKLPTSARHVVNSS